MDFEGLRVKDIRKIAAKTNCKEVTEKSGYSHVLSFLNLAAPNPARVQIYTDTGTCVILRIVNGTIRPVFFKSKCTVKDVERILKDTPDLNLVISASQIDDFNQNEVVSSGWIDGYMLEIGETILAARSQALKAHHCTLKRDRERKNSSAEYDCSFPKNMMCQVEKAINSATTDEKDLITCAAINEKAAIFLYKSGKYNATDHVPASLLTKLNQTESKPTYISLGSRGRYFVSFEDGNNHWDGPNTMENLFTGKAVRCVAFGKAMHDIITVYKDGTWKHVGNIPNKQLEKFLKEKDRSSNINCITLGPSGEYFVRDSKGQKWWGGVSNELNQAFEEVKNEKQKKSLHFVDFGSPTGAYFIIYNVRIW